MYTESSIFVAPKIYSQISLPFSSFSSIHSERNRKTVTKLIKPQ